MDAIVATHQRLVGPVEMVDAIGHVQEIVQVEQSDRQASLLVRMRGPLLDPRWESYPVDLDQIVLAYLSRGSSNASSDDELTTEAAS
jgi:ABC-2 type transport system ATP-binding protein